MSHVPRANYSANERTPAGRPNAVLKTAIPMYNVFVHYGRQLLIDDVLTVLFEHFAVEQETAYILKEEAAAVTETDRANVSKYMVRAGGNRHYETL